MGAVFCDIQDRLGRDAIQQLILLNECLENGVDLYVEGRLVARDRASRFVYGIMALVAEDQKAFMIQRTKDGNDRRLTERGRLWGGPAPYGYRRVAEPKLGYFVINEAEAAVVRRIFAWCVEGVSTWVIAQRL